MQANLHPCLPAPTGSEMYAQKKSIENAHIVRERDRQRFRELLAVLSLGIPIGLFLLLFTWQNLEVIRLGREATHLQKIRKDVGEQNKRLQVELDRLTALDSVQKRAKELGLAKTDATAIVMVSGPRSSVLGTRVGGTEDRYPRTDSERSPRRLCQSRAAPAGANARAESCSRRDSRCARPRARPEHRRRID